MQGAEYLSEATLLDAWNDLDAWTREAIAAGGEGLSGFLKRRAPLWHQVGRVCFHLAENRRSEDCPFAFLATYAPSVASGGPRPVSAAQQGPARDGGRQEQDGPGAPAIAGAGGVAKERPGEGTGRVGRPLPTVGLDAPRGLSLPQGRAGPGRERHPGAAARLVEETSPAPRGRDDRRRQAEEVRRRARCSISRCNWPWATSSSARPNGGN